jgi:tetraacyldisaccharide 4'-kinase
VPYGWATQFRNRLYDRGWKHAFRASVPVVSIGNLTLGGTGKTPCVEYVAAYYRSQGRRPVILSRGYGGRGAVNDEAMLLEENLPGIPHVQGADRVASAKRAAREWGAEVLVLDDGFQHRRLARDLDLLLVDATEPWGNGHLFPRGLLREVRQEMRRADIILLTRCDQVTAEESGRLREALGRLAPDKCLVETVHEPVGLVDSVRATWSVDELRDRTVAAFCGIGNPDAFERTLLGLGARVEALRVFPDHHRYTPIDVKSLDGWARQLAKDCVVVTTQKDLVKLRLPEVGGKPLRALRVRLQARAGREELDRKLKEALR